MDLQNDLILKVNGSGISNAFHIVVNDRLTRSILFSFRESDFAELTNNIADSDVFVEDIENGKEIPLSFGIILLFPSLVTLTILRYCFRRLTRLLQQHSEIVKLQAIYTLCI